MSRKGLTKTRVLKPDTLYQSVVIQRLINYAMRDGKKTPAESQVYLALQKFGKEIGANDLVASFEQALDNIKPKVEVRPRRIGGAVYQVPTPVRSYRQHSLAIRWLVTNARNLPNKQYHSFADKLSSLLVLSYKNEGPAIVKRQEVERMAEANKAFAHLRW